MEDNQGLSYNPIVYTVKTGKKIHLTKKCVTLRKSKNIQESNLSHCLGDLNLIEICNKCKELMKKDFVSQIENLIQRTNSNPQQIHISQHKEDEKENNKIILDEEILPSNIGYSNYSYSSFFGSCYNMRRELGLIDNDKPAFREKKIIKDANLKVLNVNLKNVYIQNQFIEDDITSDIFALANFDMIKFHCKMQSKESSSSLKIKIGFVLMIESNLDQVDIILNDLDDSPNLHFFNFGINIDEVKKEIEISLDCRNGDITIKKTEDNINSDSSTEIGKENEKEVEKQREPEIRKKNITAILLNPKKYMARPFIICKDLNLLDIQEIKDQP